MFRKIISQKKYLGKTLRLTALGLSGSLALAPVSADILYTSDFETNDTVISIDSYPPMYNSGNSPTIVGVEKGITPRSGSKMMESYLNRSTSPTNYRTEAVIKETNKFKNIFERGKEYWVGASVYLPQDWDMDYGGTKKNGAPTEERHAGGIILQFHDRAYLAPGRGSDRDGSWRDGLTLVVNHTKQGFKISNRSFGCRERPACLSNPNIKNKIEILSETVPMKLGQWNDFVFHVKFSPNSDGFMKVWTNGKIAYNHQGSNYFNEVTDEAYPFFKMGLYQSQYKLKGWSKDAKWNVNERRIYHDNLRIGDANSSYNEIVSKGGEIPPVGLPDEDSEPSANRAPTVSFVVPQRIQVPETIVAGMVTDDGLPNNTLMHQWTKKSGPGVVSFNTPNATETKATFSKAGTYLLRLTTNDGDLAGSAIIRVIVDPFD